MKSRSFLIAGGDRRQIWLRSLLEKDGHQVTAIGLSGEEEMPETVGRADCVVLPVPPADGEGLLHAPFSQSRIPLGKLTEGLPPGQLVCAGGVTPQLQRIAEERGLLLVNYLARPELAEANAVPTAEGAIRIAMEELPCTLHRCPCLVIGAGRCGMALARRLEALGALVTVSARSWKDFAAIQGQNMTCVHTKALGETLGEYRLVVNTVPALILDEVRLRELQPGCLVIDIASKPGGVDWEAAGRLGVKAISALGLPGKESPQTAAENLRDGIYHIMQECDL